MPESDKPSRLARVKARWPMPTYYGGVLRALPGLSWRALDTVDSVLIALVVIGAFLWLFSAIPDQFEIPLWVPAAFFAAALGGGVLRANYDEIKKRDAEIIRLDTALRDHKAKSDKELMKDVRRNLRSFAHDNVISAAKKGTQELFVPLRDADDPIEVGWTVKVDEWDASNVEMLRQWWGDDAVGIYTHDTGLVGQVEDWRSRLLTHIASRTGRLLEISKRKSKYDDDK